MKWQIQVLIALIVLLLGILGGWNLHKILRPCPAIIHDTISIVDSVEIHIIDHAPFYVQHLDTILYPDTILQQVDTAKILKNYFALHIYDRDWKDTNIVITLRDTITQNKYLHNDFAYKILRPQTIINNTVDNYIIYNHYGFIGFTGVLKDYKQSSIDFIYAAPKLYLGVGYNPYINGVNFKAGIKLFKFKTK
jgi:hypothetical protein